MTTDQKIQALLKEMGLDKSKFGRAIGIVDSNARRYLRPGQTEEELTNWVKSALLVHEHYQIRIKQLELEVLELNKKLNQTQDGI